MAGILTPCGGTARWRAAGVVRVGTKPPKVGTTHEGCGCVRPSRFGARAYRSGRTRQGSPGERRCVQRERRTAATPRELWRDRKRGVGGKGVSGGVDLDGATR